MLAVLRNAVFAAIARLKDTSDTYACTQTGHLVCIMAPGWPKACLQEVHDTTAYLEATRTACGHFPMRADLLSMMSHCVTVKPVVSADRVGML